MRDSPTAKTPTRGSTAAKGKKRKATDENEANSDNLDAAVSKKKATAGSKTPNALAGSSSTNMRADAGTTPTTPGGHSRSPDQRNIAEEFAAVKG